MNLREELMEEARRFMKNRVIFTAAELDLFTRLQAHPETARGVAEAMELNLRAVTRLLDVLVTFDLLDKDASGRYVPTEQGALLASNHPQTVLPMVLHYARLWKSWSALTDIVRQGSESYPRTPIAQDESSRKAFIGAMHVIGRELSMEVARVCDLKRFKKLLDVGGASGTYTIAFLRENPDMTAVIFDLPQVVAMAGERLEAEGFSERVALIAGDFYEDELPEGCDLAFLSAIIHQNSPAQNVELYRKIYRALEPGGVLIIRDHIMDETRTKPAAGALFALNMLVNTAGGDTYTFAEVKATLEQAGFVDIQLRKFGERMDGLVEARKAA